MRLTLDTGQMRECLDLWRHSLAMRVTQHARASSLNQERSEGLEKIDASIDGWLDLLRLCTPEGEADKRELQAMTEHLREFKLWADQARMALAIVRHAGDVHRQVRKPARPSH
jgi:hypothetical protein